MNDRLLTAETEEDFQAVGLLGREALILNIGFAW